MAAPNEVIVTWGTTRDARQLCSQQRDGLLFKIPLEMWTEQKPHEFLNRNPRNLISSQGRVLPRLPGPSWTSAEPPPERVPVPLKGQKAKRQLGHVSYSTGSNVITLRKFNKLTGKMKTKQILNPINLIAMYLCSHDPKVLQGQFCLTSKEDIK